MCYVSMYVCYKNVSRVWLSLWTEVEVEAVVASSVAAVDPAVARDYPTQRCCVDPNVAWLRYRAMYPSR